MKKSELRQLIKEEIKSIKEISRNDSPILPLGTINLKTGESKYFNIYDTWGEDSTYEIWEVYGERNPEKKLTKIIATAGIKPLYNIGDSNSFIHDQNRRYLFQGKLIDFAVGSDLKNLASKYGNRIKGYTYK